MNQGDAPVQNQISHTNHFGGNIIKKLTALLLAVILVLGLAACAAPAKQDTTSKTEPAAAETTSTDAATTPETEASGDTVTLKFACDDTQSSSYYIALEQFEKEVEEKTNGAVQVELYGDAQLGNATDTIEGMQLGTIECTFASTAAVSQFVPEFYYVDAPFIFRDADHAHAVVDGEVGQIIGDASIEKQGIRVLGWMDTAFRNIYSSKAVRTVDDLKGLKIRTMQSDLHTATFEALGCLPTPMSSSEVYSSLSSGVIDAAENCYSYVLNQSMYEVAPYIINTEHFYGFCVIMMAEKIFQSLTAEQQQIILDASANCISFQRDLVAQQNSDAVDALKEKGVEFIDLDKAELQAKVEPVYEKYADKLPADIMEKIRNT